MSVKYPELLLIILILLLIPINIVAESNNTNATGATDYQAQMNATGLLKIITIPIDGGIYIDSVFAGSDLYYNTSFPVGVYRVSSAPLMVMKNRRTRLQ